MAENGTIAVCPILSKLESKYRAEGLKQYEENDIVYCLKETCQWWWKCQARPDEDDMWLKAQEQALKVSEDRHKEHLEIIGELKEEIEGYQKKNEALDSLLNGANDQNDFARLYLQSHRNAIKAAMDRIANPKDNAIHAMLKRELQEGATRHPLVEEWMKKHPDEAMDILSPGLKEKLKKSEKSDSIYPHRFDPNHMDEGDKDEQKK